MTETNIKFVT